MRHQNDEQIGRNILKIDSQLENNNQNHWKTKRVMPFQGRGSDFSLPLIFEQLFKNTQRNSLPIRAKAKNAQEREGQVTGKKQGKGKGMRKEGARRGRKHR